MGESPFAAETLDRLRRVIRRERIVENALALCRVCSPTGSAGEAADMLAELLQREGFEVARPAAAHPAAPAVVAWLGAVDVPRVAGLRTPGSREGSRSPGQPPARVLQFDGHLDTVHLPFVAPRADAQRITGSGACDMKAPLAAALEALLALRETDSLPAGGILFTAHDLHEAPWGDGSQFDALLAQGYAGDGLMIPEAFSHALPVRGRGQAVFRVDVSRPGPPVHEVYRPREEPAVIAVAAELVRQVADWDAALSQQHDAHAGAASVFVGQVHAGEIYNQFPQKAWLEGTRRWLPGSDPRAVEREFRERLAALSRSTGATIDCQWRVVRDSFALDVADPLVAAFESARRALGEAPLAHAGKPFVDDGNSFWAATGRAAITHGPLAGGAHTLEEWVSIDDLVRVALVYAATAVAYCAG